MFNAPSVQRCMTSTGQRALPVASFTFTTTFGLGRCFCAVCRPSRRLTVTTCHHRPFEACFIFVSILVLFIHSIIHSFHLFSAHLAGSRAPRSSTTPDDSDVSRLPVHPVIGRIDPAPRFNSRLTTLLSHQNEAAGTVRLLQLGGPALLHP